MSGGKTRQNNLQPGSRQTLTGFSALRPSGSGNPLQRRPIDQVVSILIDDRQHFEAGFKDCARQAGLEKYLAPEIQRHFAALFRGAFPEIAAAESRQELTSFLRAIPEVLPNKETIISSLRANYMQQLARDLRSAPKSKIALAESATIDQVIAAVERFQRQLADNPNQPKATAEQEIEELLKQLRQAPGGRDYSIPRSAGPYAQRDRLYEALEHGLYAAKNIWSFSPKSASAVTVVNYLSDCNIKLAGREPQYESLHVNNLVRSVPEPQALRPYWEHFLTACSTPSAAD